MRSISHLGIPSETKTDGTDKCTFPVSVGSDDHIQARSRLKLGSRVCDKVPERDAHDRARLELVFVLTLIYIADVGGFSATGVSIRAAICALRCECQSASSEREDVGSQLTDASIAWRARLLADDGTSEASDTSSSSYMELDGRFCPRFARLGMVTTRTECVVEVAFAGRA